MKNIITLALLTLAFAFINPITNLQAQDWNQEGQEMYEDLMNTVNQTYQETYDKHMSDFAEIERQQRENEQLYYEQAMDMVNRSYEESYAYYSELFNQIIANAEADATKMQAELMAQGQLVYQQALAKGYSDAQAQQMAVSTIGNIASTNNITNGFGHNLTMSIMNNYPNGSGTLYKYADGSVSNWATKW